MAARCCDGSTTCTAVGSSSTLWEVACVSCGRVLATVEAPREEVYAHV